MSGGFGEEAGAGQRVLFGARDPGLLSAVLQRFDPYVVVAEGRQLWQRVQRYIALRGDEIAPVTHSMTLTRWKLTWSRAMEQAPPLGPWIHRSGWHAIRRLVCTTDRDRVVLPPRRGWIARRDAS